MKLAKIISIGILIIINGTALAAGPGTPSDTISPQNAAHMKPMSEMTALQVSPMYLEIKGILEDYAQTEKTLLRDLSLAVGELEARRIISKIEKLDLERDLGILKIQARYAHQEQRWALEKQIRYRIRKLEEGSLLAAHK